MNLNFSKKLQANKLQAGFTLIELLVVIAIIGILSGIVLTSLGTARNKAKDAAVKSQMSSTRAQAEIYSDDNGTNGFEGVCAALASASPGGIKTLLDGAAANNAVANTVVVVDTTAGAYNVTTCHDTSVAWAAESPLFGSASGVGNAKMFCVDSNGTSKETTSNLAASAVVCP